MYVYLVFLLLFFVLPVLLLALRLRKALPRYRRTILWSLLFVGTFGLAWDWLCVRTGVWRYDSARTLGIWLGGLPIEELAGFYLFGTLLIVFVTLLLIERSNRV